MLDDQESNVDRKVVLGGPPSKSWSGPEKKIPKTVLFKQRTVLILK